MKTSLLLVALVAVTGLNCGPGSGLDVPSASKANPLVADVTCINPQSKAVVLQGMAEVLKGKPEDLDSDSAVVYDRAGRAHPAIGFGLTGETITLVAGNGPTTTRLELGQSPAADVQFDDLVQCSFSKVAFESRLLTAEDVDGLGIDRALIGADAELHTSFHGIIWVFS